MEAREERLEDHGTGNADVNTRDNGEGIWGELRNAEQRVSEGNARLRQQSGFPCEEPPTSTLRDLHNLQSAEGTTPRTLSQGPSILSPEEDAVVCMEDGHLENSLSDALVHVLREHTSRLHHCLRR